MGFVGRTGSAAPVVVLHLATLQYRRLGSSTGAHLKGSRQAAGDSEASHVATLCELQIKPMSPPCTRSHLHSAARPPTLSRPLIQNETTPNTRRELPIPRLNERSTMHETPATAQSHHAPVLQPRHSDHPACGELPTIDPHLPPPRLRPSLQNATESAEGPRLGPRHHSDAIKATQHTKVLKKHTSTQHWRAGIKSAAQKPAGKFPEDEAGSGSARG